MRNVLEMTDAELQDRARRVPELAKCLLVPPVWYGRMSLAASKVMTGKPVATFGGIRVTENPFLPPHVCVWVDERGQVLSVMRMDE